MNLSGDPDPDPQPPRFGGRLPALLAILLFAGAATAFVLTFRYINRPAPPTKGPVAATTKAPSVGPDSARFAQKDECVSNRGTDDSPDLIKVACAKGTLQILARVERTSDVKVCQKVGGYQFHYFFDSELVELDFVLCMRIYTP